MNGSLSFVLHIVLVGVGATVVMDLWGVLLALATRAPMPDYTMVGRWMGHFPRGRFVQENIRAAAAVPGEAAICWSAHYLIGILYAALLVALEGAGWLQEPTLLPALAVALALLVAPYFIMQPGLGMGIAASRMPKPWVARLRSLVTHAVFGFGLYLAAWLLAVIRA